MPRPRPLVAGFLAGLSVVAGCSDTSNVDQSAVALDSASTASDPHLSDAISESDVASILKASVAHRVDADIDGVARGFTKVAVVDTFGAEGPYGNIEFTAQLGQLTAPQRRAVLDALAPREVEFISPAEFAERPWADDGGAAVAFGVPEWSDGHVEMYSELQCGEVGAPCADGGVHWLERKDSGGWIVTKSNGGWIA